MATVIAPRLKLRSDDLFFSGMAVVSLIIVFVGFARTYFLAGMFRAPLPNLLVHIHGAVFTLWIVLLISQIWLVALRRVDLHRHLGLLGFGLAAVMVVLGLLTASDQLARHVSQPGADTIEEVRAFYAIPVADVLMFSTFVSFGYRYRSHPGWHKRLMLFATISLLDAGFDRWPVFDPYPLALVNLICFTPLVLLILGYDWWSTGKLQRVTLWSTAFLITVQESRHLIKHTAAWQTFATWVQTHMPSFS